MVKISAVVSAYNEEKNIEDCLKSLAWVDEIIVIDNSSQDKTAALAKKYTPHVIKRENYSMLNKNKNFGFSKATSDWILNLDADERVSYELQEEIKSKLQEDTLIDGYWIPRKNIIFGKWIQHSIWWPDPHLRLFKKGKGKFAEKHVHEHITVDGTTSNLSEVIVHHNYSSISQFLRKLNDIYTENEVDNKVKEGVKVGYIDAIKYPTEDFFKTFFYQKGYKDGVHGLVLSLLQSFYTFVVFAKLWERQGFQEEYPDKFLEKLYKEAQRIGYKFHFWFLSVFILEEKNPIKKVYYKILRKKIVSKT